MTHTIIEGALFAAFYAYFGVHVVGQDKAWVPHVICGNCRSTLEVWHRGETGADPGRNLTRAQQKDRGRGYIGVAISQNYEQKRASSSDFYY